MYLHCIRSFCFFCCFFFFFFLRERFADFFNIQVLSTSVPYVFALYTYVTRLKDVSDFLDSSQLYALVYIYCSNTCLGGFPIYFYCVRLCTFVTLKDISVLLFLNLIKGSLVYI